MLTLYKGTATIDVATVLGHISETETQGGILEMVKLLGSNHKLTQHIII